MGERVDKKQHSKTKLVTSNYKNFWSQVYVLWSDRISRSKFITAMWKVIN